MFDKLEQLLGKDAMADKESYDFTRWGKKDAIKLALAQTTGTLRPDKASSKDWDTTQNLYIEGDNLEVLRTLQNSYRNKVKMIYIDPPYNTGKDFIYKDNFVDNVVSYKEKMEENLKSNPETNWRYHTDWLNMMYPRLKIARDLLKNDGTIFISIDDNEVTNLKKICDEIFREENFVAQLPTIMNLKWNNDEYWFAWTHEYTLVYCKNKKNTLFWEFIVKDEELEDWGEDEYGAYKKWANLKSTGTNAPREKRPNLYFPLYITKKWECLLERQSADDFEIYPITKGQEMSWRWEKKKFLKDQHNLIISNDDGDISIYKKQRPSLWDLPTKKPKTIFYKPEYSSWNGTQQMKDLFGWKIFDNPKPLDLIQDLIVLWSREWEIILDLFSWSATTAHAIIALNGEDDWSRKFIMIQLPELTDVSSEAYKAWYKNICEIWRERIRRAWEKVKQAQTENINNDKDLDAISKKDKLEQLNKLDIWFKCFTLDTTNLKKRDPNPENINESLFNAVDALKEERSQEDMLYEIMLKNSMDLTSPIETKTIDGKEVYIVAYGKLIVCLATDLSLTTIQSLIALEPADMKELDNRSTIILYDKWFDTDVTKLNALKQVEHAWLECIVI